MSVKLSPPRTIVIIEWVCNIRGMTIGRGIPNFSQKDLSHCQSVQTNRKWTALGLNLGLRWEKTNNPELWHGLMFDHEDVFFGSWSCYCNYCATVIHVCLRGVQLQTAFHVFLHHLETIICNCIICFMLCVFGTRIILLCYRIKHVKWRNLMYCCMLCVFSLN
jgi:hypothetical protein